MFSLIKTIGLKKLLATEAPAFLLSILLAETVYKFGSFILECLAFLVTWGVISYLINAVLVHRKEGS
jgi:hypothetical protein